MATVKRQTNSQGKGRINPTLFRAVDEATKARWDSEDGFNESDFGDGHFVVPNTDVKSLREQLGLSQEGFSERYRLSLRTIQEWEQHRREPSEPARVLLYAIANAPDDVEQALSSPRRTLQSGKQKR